MQNKKKTGIDTYQEFLKDIRGGMHPIYYLTGEEVFFHDRALDEINGLMPADLKDFNFNLVHGQDGKVDQVIGLCRSYPMMAERRIVVVRDFQLLAKGSASANEDGGNLNDFLPYLERPNPTSLVVFIDEKAIAKTTKIGKALASSPNVGNFDFSVTPDYLLADWVVDWAKMRFQSRIEPHAAQLLVQFVGGDLLLLSNEIQKLITAKKGEDVTEKDVRDLVGFAKEFTVFELKDAIIQRRTHDALVIAEHMMSQGDGAVGEMLKMLGFFSSMYLNVWQYLRMQAKGLSPDQISSSLGMNGYRLTMLQKEARLYSLNSMPAVFEILYDTDRAVKGFSTLDERSILFFMIQRLCTV
ncbi:DNA polymerase III subunit delta [bacterium]|nr:MAG: DNA polymerase III subunit delta [bacterium]